MRVTCINLRRSTDRWAYMQAQAEALGLQLHRLDGVDGTQGLPQALRPQFLGSEGEIHSTLTPGEVGCYASHLLACQHLLNSSEPFLVVLEDDAELAQDFIAATCAAVMAAPLRWDVLHLSTRFKRSAYPVAPLPGRRSLVRYARLPASTVAYVISRSGAEKFLQPKARTRPVDQEIRHAWIMGLNVLGVYPSPARQGIFPTTISGATDARQWATPLSKLRGRIQTRWSLGIGGSLYCWSRDLARYCRAAG